MIRINTDFLTYGNSSGSKFAQGEAVDWVGLMDATGTAADPVSIVWIGGSAWKIVRVLGKIVEVARLTESNPPLSVPNPVGDGRIPTGLRIGPGKPSEWGDGAIYPAGPVGGLSDKVVSIRVMNPGKSGGRDYPNGYLVYYNKEGQKIDPYTGRTIDNSNPFAHIGLGG